MNNQIKKLPKWAQSKIRTLEMERDEAVVALNQFTDQQTPSRFSFEKHPCTGEGSGPQFKRAFVQTDTIVVVWRGVKLTVDAHDHGNQGAGIILKWEGLK